ncbi:MAG: cell wall-binding repeat-containing protein, partial [Actinomycetota bacterium]|nr:cell wall-binding repeat-containing protein [Actinomycetota bacterium]
VSAAAMDDLKAEFGNSAVKRLSGDDRYETALAIAQKGVDEGLAWDGMGIATGENFPDALAGGVLAARNGSVMLLTASDVLPTDVSSKLTAERDSIAKVFYLGGLAAISQDVRDEVSETLQ